MRAARKKLYNSYETPHSKNIKTRITATNQEQTNQPTTAKRLHILSNTHS